LTLFDLAEENFLITFAIVTGIGILQGAILARGIRNRFPSLKKHARSVSVILLVLFSINAVANVLKFADPAKVSVSQLSLPNTLEEFVPFLMNVLGLDAGLITVITLFISLTLVLFFRFANIHRVARYFIFSISVVVVSVALLAKFTDFVPTIFQVVSYAFYQFGLAAGIFFVSRRRKVDMLPEIS